MKRERWVWMPHAAHLIVGQDCRFHLSTYVGGYLVSTVGEYLPDERVREIHAESRGIKLEGRGDARRNDFLVKCGFIEIGAGRKYETFVFEAARDEKHACCPWTAADFSEIDTKGANEPGEATKNHMVMCAKWAKR